jgi:type IX secretion system PorP/SprF family membrane protein
VKTSFLRLRIFCLLTFFAAAVVLRGQDIHFSQWVNSPINLSPGLAGVFGGDGRFVGNFRSQWRSVPVPYQTFSGSAEGKLYYHRGQYDRYITGGLMINSDKQGSLQLQSTLVSIPVSLTLPFAKRDFVTLGIMPSFGQRHFNTDNLSFDSQWTGFTYDPSASFREPQLLQSTDLKYFDLDAGLNIRFQAKTKRSRLDVGLGLHHLNRPKQDFWSSKLTNDPGNVRLYIKSSYYASSLIQISSNMDLILNAVFEQQGGYRELVYGVGARLHLTKKMYNELALQVGFDRRHRYADAFIPHIEVLYGTWTLGFTYDINVWFNQPDVRLVTNGRAGPEVSLTYRFYRFKPLPVFKSCPMI